MSEGSRSRRIDMADAAALLSDDQRETLRQMRNEEIERKRARLAELRRQRQQRQQRRHLSPPKIFDGSLMANGVVNEAANLIAEVDKMLAGFRFADEPSPDLVANDTVAKPRLDSSVQTEGLGVFDPVDTSTTDPVVKYDKVIQTEGLEPLQATESRRETVADDNTATVSDDVRDDAPSAEPPAKPDFIDLDSVGDMNGLSEFVTRASRYVERALSIPIDITIDYTKNPSNTDIANDSASGIVSKTQMFRPDAERPINWLDWSNKFPELIVATYGSLSSSETNTLPLGQVSIWSLYLSERPEFQFQSLSEVLCAKFHPSYPTIIIGTTMSGQVVIWDQRAGREPISSTRLSAGHMTPIYGFFVTPMHSLVTVSDDGRLCTWNDKILSEPTLKKEIGNDVTPICVGYSWRDPATVYLGGENGNVYRMKIQASETHKATDLISLDAHSGPITAISFHSGLASSEIPKQLLDLYLTSSFDFTCRMWSIHQESPLITIVKDEVALDVQWCPTNPCYFALVDCDGILEIWKHGTNPHAAFCKIRIASGPCTKLAWASHGKHIAVGDFEGKLHLLDIPASIYEFSHHDLLQLSKYIHSLSNNSGL